MPGKSNTRGHKKLKAKDDNQRALDKIIVGSKQNSKEAFALLISAIELGNNDIVSILLTHDTQNSFFNETQRLELLDRMISDNLSDEIYTSLDTYFAPNKIADKMGKAEISRQIIAIKKYGIALPPEIDITLNLLNQVARDPSDRDLLKFLLCAQDTFGKTPFGQAMEVRDRGSFNVRKKIFSHIKSVTPSEEDLKAMGFTSGVMMLLSSNGEITLNLLNQLDHNSSDQDLLKLLCAQDAFGNTLLGQAMTLPGEAGLNATKKVISLIKSIKNPSEEDLKAMGVWIALMDAINDNDNRKFFMISSEFNDFISKKNQKDTHVAKPRKNKYPRLSSQESEQAVTGQENHPSNEHHFRCTYSMLNSSLLISNKGHVINNNYNFEMPVGNNVEVSMAPQEFQEPISTTLLNNDTLDMFWKSVFHMS